MADQTSSSPTHPLSGKQIIVSGAGIGGLAFAISFHKLWPSVSPNGATPPQITIYERDPCAVPENRKGYSLSLRSDSPTEGIQTLQRMGILDRLIAANISSMGEGSERGEGEGGFCIWNVKDSPNNASEPKKWIKVIKAAAKTPPGCPVSGMRIARADLRRTLVEAAEQLPGVKIHWASTITSVQPSADDGKVVVTLSTGTSHTADLLIAADGSASKLRTALRPNDTLQFAGPTCIYGICPIASLHPSGRANEFGTVISGLGKACFFAPVDNKTMVWSLSWHVTSPPAPAKLPLAPAEISALLAEARQEGLAIFGPRFEKVLQATDPDSVTRFNAMDKPAFAHTPGYVQVPALNKLEGKVIFLGDANHAVSPFAGNGANLALGDASTLAESLLKDSDGNASGFEQLLEAATKKYDAVAVGRARKVVKMSHMNISIMHSKGWVTWMWMTVLRVVSWVLFRNVN